MHALPFVDLGSTCAHHIGLLTGTVDLVLECTRKWNLETVCSYRLLRQVGGCAFALELDSSGVLTALKDFSQQRYSDFHFDVEDHTPILLARSEDLAKRFIRKLFDVADNVSL